MSQIVISHLTFAYPGSFDNVFEDASFILDTSWRLGLTGRNGRGKTTLLRLLTGELESRGAVHADVPFLCFPFPVTDTAAEAGFLLETLLPTVPEWRILREINLLSVSQNVLYRPFNTLSNGEQTKLLLASLFLHEDAFPLIDEPTNHLDALGRQILGEYLARKSGYILVSHDRALLDRCTDHMLAIERQRITVMQGNFSAWERERERSEAAERAQNERLEKDIARLGEAARRTEQWASKAEREKHARNSGLRPDRGYLGHKAAKMMKRAKTTQARQEAAAAEKKTLLRNVDEAEALKLRPLAWPKGGPLVRAEDVALGYGGAPVCAGLSFTLAAGERIAVTGSNGCGKSTLLKALCAAPEVCVSGRLTAAAGLRISCVPQDASFLSGSVRAYAQQAASDETLFFTLLRKLGFERVQFDKDMAGFSAGQKKKVLLARSLCESAHIYIWDEPLNYVDVLSRMQIEQLLLQYPATMLFVEHDAAFVQQVATRTLAL